MLSTLLDAFGLKWPQTVVAAQEAGLSLESTPNAQLWTESIRAAIRAEEQSRNE
jgi:hypothetical protein